MCIFILIHIICISLWNKILLGLLSWPQATFSSKVDITDSSAKIEREVDKRGINRTQYIREAIHDKLNESAYSDVVMDEVKNLKSEVEELRKNILKKKTILLLMAQK